MSVARSLREWVFIQAYNNRLLTTEKVADECKANKLVDKRSRKKWRSLFSLLEDKNHAHQVYKKIKFIFLFPYCFVEGRFQAIQSH